MAPVVTHRVTHLLRTRSEIQVFWHTFILFHWREMMQALHKFKLFSSSKPSIKFKLLPQYQNTGAGTVMVIDGKSHQDIFIEVYEVLQVIPGQRVSESIVLSTS